MLTMYTFTVPVFRRMLQNARTWLDKAAAFAEAKKFDPNVFMTQRLAPDMFAFARQIQSATDNAKGCCARLANVDVPKYDDNETTLAELQARIDKTVAFLDTLKPEQFEGAESREIVAHFPRGERRWPSGENYFSTYAMPNFFFHVTTAYAILRHNGVDVGKVDYLAGHKG